MKKIIVFLLSVMMLFSLTACINNQNEQQNAVKPTPSSNYESKVEESSIVEESNAVDPATLSGEWHNDMSNTTISFKGQGDCDFIEGMGALRGTYTYYGNKLVFKFEGNLNYTGIINADGNIVLDGMEGAFTPNN